PAVPPPCAKYGCFPPLIIMPRPQLPKPGVNICFVIAGDSTRFDFPASESCISMAKRARSDGVLHKPAGAISGYTCGPAARGIPSFIYGIAVPVAGLLKGGCSKVLRSIPIGPNTVLRMNL